MVTKRYLEKKWLKPLEAKRRKEWFEDMSLAAREQFTNQELDKIRYEAHEKGRQEGVKESYKSTYGEGFRDGFKEGLQVYAAWNHRREEAAAQGLPFEEPPPTS